MGDRTTTGLKRKAVGVLMGGMSEERDISIESGKAILRALSQKGYIALPVEAGPDLPWRLRRLKVEVVFNALHGKFGEDGAVQGMLEILRIPYTGSGVLSSAIGMDKVSSKKHFEHAGLPVPPWCVIRKGEGRPRIPFGFPVVVKPSAEGSSIGVTILRTRTGLPAALKRAWAYDNEAIVEKYIPGKEVTVGILEGRAIGAMEVIPKGEYVSFTVKYTPGLEEFIIPAPLSKLLYLRVLALGERAFEALGCEGYSRVDLRVDPRGRPFVLEVNTLPGMTSLSYLPRIAGWRGISYEELVERILATARLKIRTRRGVCNG